MEIEGIPVGNFYPYLCAADKIPGRRHGKKVSRRTVERWRHHGVLRDGVRVRLRAVQLGGNDWYTCDRWLREFLAALNEAPGAADQAAQSPRTPSQREAASRAARRQLEEKWEGPKTHLVRGNKGFTSFTNTRF